jgi:alanine-synthesizing transaminase
VFSSRFKWSLETNRIARLLEEKRRAGAPILDLTASNPTQAGLHYPADEILAALAAPPALRYDPTPKGLAAAREAVSSYYRERGEAVDPARVHLTASTSEAYAWLFKLLADAGDAVLVPQPSYPLFDFLASLEGVELRPYELSYVHPRGWRVDFDSLARAAPERTRAVVVVNPNNPTGSFLKRDELGPLLDFCAARGLALVVDEVFSDYVLAGDAGLVTATTQVNAVLTFTLGGFSKTLGLPQMKLGWVVTNGPELLRAEADARLDLIADTFLSVNTPAQHAAPAWLALRGNIQGQILDRARGNLSWLSEHVRDSPCRLLKVEGGWSATVELPRLMSEEELVLKLLEEDDVLAHPGYFFDFPREAFLVLSLLAPEADFREAVARIVRRFA